MRDNRHSSKTYLRTHRPILLPVWVLLIFMSIPKEALGQKAVSVYKDYSGQELTLLSDSTFEFTVRGHLDTKWSKGIWERVNDTLFLKVVPVYDTLFHQDNIGVASTQLVLSWNNISESVTDKQYKPNEDVLGGQLVNLDFQKLFFKKGRLYLLKKNGQLSRSKYRSTWTGKKYPTYFSLQASSK